MSLRIRRVVGGLLASLSLVAWSGTGVASASSDRAEFVAQARAAGLTAEQAAALQGKVDGYLAKLAGRGTQVSPNQIDLKGAVLNVAVPGEAKPRSLAPATTNVYNAPECVGGVEYGWFCAFEHEYLEGDNIGMYRCGTYGIPWWGFGSWENEQTPGTVPVANMIGGPPVRLRAAPSVQLYGVDWSVVVSIRNC